MRIAIDTGPLESGHKVRGIGMMTSELTKQLVELAKKEKSLQIKPVDFLKTNLSKYDLAHYQYFHPFFLTLPANFATKSIVTVHDLIPLIYPQHYPPGIRGRIRFLKQKARVKKADKIITISETSKKDIVRFLGVNPNKVQVIYLAPRKIFKKLKTENWKLEVVKRYSLPKQFVLYVGDINYNKNLHCLIHACKTAKLNLVICGKQALEIEQEGLVGLDELRGPADWVRFLFNVPHPEHAHYKEMADHFRGNNKIKCLGFVSDEDLVKIYNLATVYCQPSFYEGFGLPVLEAMACGTPVVAAKTQALVEIAEDAALYADPRNPKDVIKKITQLIKNSKLRWKMIKKGKEKAKKYSWKKTAKETLEVYRKILSS